MPGLKDQWWLAGLLPVCGVLVAMGCGGASIGRRLAAAAGAGAAAGVLAAVFTALVALGNGHVAGGTVLQGVWLVFVFTLLSTIGALAAEFLGPVFLAGSDGARGG